MNHWHQQHGKKEADDHLPNIEINLKFFNLLYYAYSFLYMQQPFLLSLLQKHLIFLCLYQIHLCSQVYLIFFDRILASLSWTLIQSDWIQVNNQHCILEQYLSFYKLVAFIWTYGLWVNPWIMQSVTHHFSLLIISNIFRKCY